VPYGRGSVSLSEPRPIGSGPGHVLALELLQFGTRGVPCRGVRFDRARGARADSHIDVLVQLDLDAFAAELKDRHPRNRFRGSKLSEAKQSRDDIRIREW
jgi:hypothetical protein